MKEDYSSPTMKTRRGFIDYSLDKRSTLLALFRGVVDACDADPYLMRAAKYHGEKADRNCPVCKKDTLVEIRYTFGDQLGNSQVALRMAQSWLRWRKSSVNSLCMSLKYAESVPGTISVLPIY